MNICGETVLVSRTRSILLTIRGCTVMIDPMFGGMFSVSVRNPNRMMKRGAYYNRRRDLDYRRIPAVVAELVDDALGIKS